MKFQTNAGVTQLQNCNILKLWLARFHKYHISVATSTLNAHANKSQQSKTIEEDCNLKITILKRITEANL